VPPRFIADDFPAIRSRMEELRQPAQRQTPEQDRLLVKRLVVDRQGVLPELTEFLLKYTRQRRLF
jgi:hypothetical protein